MSIEYYEGLAAEYAADAAPAPEEATNVLAAITRTAAELRGVQSEIADAEAVLKALQDRARMLEQITLPTLMDEAQQKSLTTTDGWVLKRDEVLRASIPPANLSRAIPWLIDHGQAAIVKRELKLNFGQGESARAAEALAALREHHLSPEDKQTVHAMTLAAAVREMIANGVNVPFDLLGVFIQPVVKMKPEKK